MKKLKSIKWLIIAALMLVFACKSDFKSSSDIKQKTDSLKRLDDSAKKHTTLFINKSKKSDLLMGLTIRRLSTAVDAQELDKKYYKYKSMYLETGKDKYRILGNKAMEDYKKKYALYESQSDSLKTLLKK